MFAWCSYFFSYTKHKHRENDDWKYISFFLLWFSIVTKFFRLKIFHDSEKKQSKHTLIGWKRKPPSKSPINENFSWICYSINCFFFLIAVEWIITVTHIWKEKYSQPFWKTRNSFNQIHPMIGFSSIYLVSYYTWIFIQNKNMTKTDCCYHFHYYIIE